ncbi:MAG: hypothetical protein WD690_03055 [Vicinamibacterales bacterium]
MRREELENAVAAIEHALARRARIIRVVLDPEGVEITEIYRGSSNAHVAPHEPSIGKEDRHERKNAMRARHPRGLHLVTCSSPQNCEEFYLLLDMPDPEYARWLADDTRLRIASRQSGPQQPPPQYPPPDGYGTSIAQLRASIKAPAPYACSTDVVTSNPPPHHTAVGREL